MTHIQFLEAGLHNRHIRFILGGELLQGVIMDDASNLAGKTKRTHYTFIPKGNLLKWKEAEKEDNKELMKSLSLIVDIENINWGEQIIDTSGQLFREVELVQFLKEIIFKNKSFKETYLEVPLGVSRYRADLVTKRLIKRKWVNLIVEVKVITAFTHEELLRIIEQLNNYKRISNCQNVAFVFPGILLEEDKAKFTANGIDVWDVEYIAQTFGEEIEATPHPIFQEFYLAAKKQSPENKLLSELKSIPAGRNDQNWSKYEKLIEKIFDELFGSALSPPIRQSSDYFNINRRDFILRNYAEVGFWAQVRDRYYADYVVVEAKNYSQKITKKEVLQIAHYLKVHGPGLFGIIVTRSGGDKGCYLTCREVWAMHKKMIIVLDDENIKKMIIAKSYSNDPELIIRQKIEEFRLSM